jgi:hypothetical protein
MADHGNTVRMLHRHDWRDPEEWVQSLDALARLTDEEIARLFKAGVVGSAANENVKAS